jgi:hypothetical protein
MALVSNIVGNQEGPQAKKDTNTQERDTYQYKIHILEKRKEIKEAVVLIL